MTSGPTTGRKRMSEGRLRRPPRQPFWRFDYLSLVEIVGGTSLELGMVVVETGLGDDTGG